MTAEDEAIMGWQISQFLYRAAAFGDAGQWDALANLFAEDGELSRPSAPGHPIKGREAILESFRARPDRSTRHLLSNIVVSPADSENAIVTSIVTMLAGPATNQLVEADRVVMVGTYEDRLRRVEGEWKFVRRAGSMTLRYDPKA